MYSGPDIKPNVNFAAIPRVKGLLGIGSGVAGVTDSQLEIYQKTAATVAAQVVGEKSRQFLIPCTPKVTNAADAECARTFLTAWGGWLYRRPMPDARLDDLVKNAGEAAESLHDFYQGLGVALEGLLISPNVLVVAEATENDPDRKGEQRLDAYSLATRLALFLWNAAPDDELLKSAGSGAFADTSWPRTASRSHAGEPAPRGRHARLLRRHVRLRPLRHAVEGCADLPVLLGRNRPRRARADGCGPSSITC